MPRRSKSDSKTIVSGCSRLVCRRALKSRCTRILIYVLEGGRYRNYGADGKTIEGELKTGEVLYRDPLTHAAENLGNTTMHMILVELKK